MKHEISYCERRNFCRRNFRKAKNLRNFWNKLLQMIPLEIFCDSKLLRMGNFSYRINKYPIQTIIFALNCSTNNDHKFTSKSLSCEKSKFLQKLTFANSL